jgi:hypothetical protein
MCSVYNLTYISRTIIIIIIIIIIITIFCSTQ